MNKQQNLIIVIIIVLYVMVRIIYNVYIKPNNNIQPTPQEIEQPLDKGQSNQKDSNY